MAPKPPHSDRRFTERTGTVQAAARRVAGRMDRSHRVRALALAALTGAVAAAMVAAARALSGHPARHLGAWLAGAGALAVIPLAAGLLRRTALWRAAKRLDDALGLDDLCSSALFFDAAAGDELGEPERLVVTAAEARAATVDASAVVPATPWPSRPLALAAALAACAATLFWIGPPRRGSAATARPRQSPGAIAAEQRDIDRLLAEVDALRKAADQIHLDDPAKKALSDLDASLRSLEARLGESDKADVMAKLSEMQSEVEKAAAAELEKAAKADDLANAAALAKKMADEAATSKLGHDAAAAAADALEKAAESAGEHTAAGADLSKAAEALEKGRMDEARRALDRAGAELSPRADAAAHAASSRRVLDALRRDIDATKSKMGGEDPETGDDGEFAGDETDPSAGDPGSDEPGGGKEARTVCTPLPDGGMHCEKMSAVASAGAKSRPGGSRSGERSGESGAMLSRPAGATGAATAELEKLLGGAHGSHGASGMPGSQHDPGHDWETQAPRTPDGATLTERDNATRVGSPTAVSQVEAAGTGKPESLEDRGFVETLLEYEKIAEDEMYGEDVPPERRPYVQRYFERIHPQP